VAPAPEKRGRCPLLCHALRQRQPQPATCCLLADQLQLRDFSIKGELRQGMTRWAFWIRKSHILVGNRKGDEQNKWWLNGGRMDKLWSNNFNILCHPQLELKVAVQI